VAAGGAARGRAERRAPSAEREHTLREWRVRVVRCIPAREFRPKARRTYVRMARPAYLRDKCRELRLARKLTIDELAERLAVAKHDLLLGAGSADPRLWSRRRLAGVCSCGGRASK